jgi:predicted RNA-binding protein Jag
MSQRFEGHNLEEALDQAATSFGVARHQLAHRIILEKRGFLGGIKRVVIEADVNDNPVAPEPVVEAPAPVDDAAPVVPAATPPSAAPARERGPRGGGRGRGGGGRERGGRRDEERGGRGGRLRHRESDVRPGDFSHFATDIPEQGMESEAAATARSWCEEVLDLAKLNVTIRSSENDEHITLRLYGPDSSRFVEQAGELLDAVQVLANKALVGRKIEKEIELDCEEFKERRVTDLQARAHELADRVRENGREQLLPAMTPIERRIVHLALQDDAVVTTESRGDGFYKRVAIIPRADAATSSES